MSAQLPQSGLDRQLALARVGGDAELLREIAILFIEDCPRALTEIRESIASGDAAKLENAAHAIKGSVANFGASAAVETALRLELMGRTKQLGDAAESLRALEHDLSIVCAELASL